TRTQPSAGMRRFMAEAEVGDEQADLDPTVTALCERVADLLGKEKAVYLPSGTMCNEIAYRVHCRPGDEIILDRTAHGIIAEAGGPAALALAMLYPLDGERGQFSPGQVEGAVRSGSRYEPRSRLISIEQTSNWGGGSIWPLETIGAIGEIARARGLAMHMDGARLMNAVVESGIEARAYAKPFDTLWLDFSKGLGAPVGAVLAGSADFIHEAWRLKQQMGGAMRQAGIIAAACLYALDHNIDRLSEDHANAKRLARGLAEMNGIHLDPGLIETNIIFFDLGSSAPTARSVAARLLESGVRIGAMGERRMRAVTHLDVDGAAIDRALSAMADALRG
ncbi:MAG: beta-eliminating lyase-related protein, partial [Alphaproteobacteria bacterium]|nr:beta-eliminating lyase-related protein [Alphaproteobacteria bacterium]